MPTVPSSIGTLAEKSLHAALKAWYAQPGDRFEASVGGFVIDILRGDLLIEIQTGSFSKLRRKFETLLGAGHAIRLLYPLPAQKWIVRQTEGGEPLGRRKSPKKGRPVDVFRELVRIPDILPHPRFSWEVLLTHEEEIWRDDGQGSWRRKGWSRHDRRLLEVASTVKFEQVADTLRLLPDGLPPQFTNRELAGGLHCRLSLARKMTYTLRKAGVLEQCGQRGRAFLYKIRTGEAGA